MDRTVRNRVHTGAVVIYHIALVFYLLILMLKTVNFAEYGAGYLRTMGERALPLLRVLMTVLLAEKLIRMKTRAVPAVLLAAAAWIVGEEELLDLCLLTAVSDLARERKTLRLVLWIYAVLACLMMLLEWQGMLEAVSIQFAYRKGISLGFGHPNTPAAYLMILDLILWVLYLREQKPWTAVLFVGSAALCWLVFASRTAAVLLAVFPLGAYAVEKIGKSRRAGLLKAAAALPFLLAVLTVGLMLVFYFKLTDWKSLGMDRNLSLRFRYPAMELKEAGGQITWLKREYFWASRPLDTQYINTLLNGGILGCVLLVIQMTWCMILLYRRRRWDLLAVMLLLSIYGVMECILTRMEWNIVALILLSAEENPEKEGASPVFSEETVPWIRMTIRRKALVSLMLAGGVVLAALALPERNALPGQTTALAAEPAEAGEILGGGSEEKQSFRAEAPFSGVQVVCATYYTLPAGTLQAELLDENGEVLETGTVNAWNARDNAYLSIPFRREYPEGNYSLKISEAKLAWGAVSLWRNGENPYPEGALELNGADTESDWAFRLYRGGTPGRTVLQRDCLMAGVMLLLGIWMVPDLKKKKNPGR